MISISNKVDRINSVEKRSCSKYLFTLYSVSQTVTHSVSNCVTVIIFDYSSQQTELLPPIFILSLSISISF